MQIQNHNSVYKLDQPVNYYFSSDLAITHILSFVYLSFFLYSDKYLRYMDIQHIDKILILIHLGFIYYLSKLISSCSKEWILQRNVGSKSVNDIIARKQLKTNMPTYFIMSIINSTGFYYGKYCLNLIEINSFDLGVLTKNIDISICQSITIFVLTLCYGFLISKLKQPGIKYNELGLTPIEQYRQKNLGIITQPNNYFETVNLQQTSVKKKKSKFINIHDEFSDFLFLFMLTTLSLINSDTSVIDNKFHPSDIISCYNKFHPGDIISCYQTLIAYRDFLCFWLCLCMYLLTMLKFINILRYFLYKKT